MTKPSGSKLAYFTLYTIPLFGNAMLAGEVAAWQHKKIPYRAVAAIGE